MASGLLLFTLLLVLDTGVIHSTSPVFIPPPKESWPTGPIQAGDSITLSCFIHPAGSGSVQWRKDGKPIIQSSHVAFREDHQMLKILRSEVTDTGVYRCTAISEQGEASQMYQQYIEVKDSWSSPPVVTNMSPANGKLGVHLGSSVNISCTFSSGELCDQQTMGWWKNGTQVEDSGRFQWMPGGSCMDGQKSLQLQIMNITSEDLGIYTCSGENIYGNISREITLTVLNTTDQNPDWGEKKILSILIPSTAGLVVVVLLVAAAVWRRRQNSDKYEHLEWEEPDLAHFETPDCAVEYDVFISYSSDDLDWVKNVLFQHLRESGYNVCVDFKDFAPGMPICENVMDSIYKSKRTLIVMSRNFLKSMWGQFELQQAHNRAVVKREDVIILIRLDNCKVPAKLMGKTFLDWTDLNVKPYFWGRLKDAIGQPGDFQNADPMDERKNENGQPVEKPDVNGRDMARDPADLVIDMDNNYLVNPAEDKEKNKNHGDAVIPNKNLGLPKSCRIQ